MCFDTANCLATIVDMQKEQKYDAENGPSKCSWSPYDDMTFTGWPVMTVVRGEIVAAQGKVMAKPGLWHVHTQAVLKSIYK